MVQVPRQGISQSLRPACLPSSFRIVFLITLEFSSHPPVLVCGTDSLSILDFDAFPGDRYVDSISITEIILLHRTSTMHERICLTHTILALKRLLVTDAEASRLVTPKSYNEYLPSTGISTCCTSVHTLRRTP